MELTHGEKEFLLKRLNELKKTVKFLKEEQIPGYEKAYHNWFSRPAP